MEALLDVQIRRAGYIGERQAVTGIDFSVHRGELVGLIGPNGAGKSTTIKAILGLLPEMDGEISLSVPHGRYAYIPEQPILYDELTLWEHLELAAAAFELERDTFLRESERLLGLFRLEKERHRLPGSFSKGMQQKLMLVIAFLIQADVYIVDEPFMGLDPRAIMALLALLDRERKRGAGILMSTHALDTAERICDSFVLLAEGKLVTQGSLKEIRAGCGLYRGSLFECFNRILENME
jgi:ABC-2 type transport system ATP-binding protein